MNCVVTAGPTYEPVDEVRRLTNFSTGKLGVQLGNHLVARGHRVILLRGYYSVWRGEVLAQTVKTFTTGADLQSKLAGLSAKRIDAVFHAAAVGDFIPGKVWEKAGDGRLKAVRSRKISSRGGVLLAELIPAPKILERLRDLFPGASLIGWKYEVDGTRSRILGLARRQLREARVDGSVANGPGYGRGFGFVTADGEVRHCSTRLELFRILEEFCRVASGRGR